MSTERCNRPRVEQYFLGEGGREEKAATRKHIDGCDTCRAQLAALETERREYLLAHPFRAFAAQSLPQRRASWKRVFAPRWLPVYAAALCLLLLPLALRPENHRFKGGATAAFYVKRDGQVRPGDTLPYRAGDELQFVYSASGRRFVTLASVDSRRHVSLYRAEDARFSQPALPGDGQPLPFGVTLDDSDGSELFALIFGDAALDPSQVQAWLLDAFEAAQGDLQRLKANLPPAPGNAAVTRTWLLKKADS
jgi:hypothetical protein